MLTAVSGVRSVSPREGDGCAEAMSFSITQPRLLFRREGVRNDAMAGLVLGVERIPDGLASGLLASVNPVAGPCGCMSG
jgi:hypothetical protein